MIKRKQPLNVDASSKACTYTVWKRKKTNDFLFQLEIENDFFILKSLKCHIKRFIMICQ